MSRRGRKHERSNGTRYNNCAEYGWLHAAGLSISRSSPWCKRIQRIFLEQASHWQATLDPVAHVLIWCGYPGRQEKKLSRCGCMCMCVCLYVYVCMYVWMDVCMCGLLPLSQDCRLRATIPTCPVLDRSCTLEWGFQPSSRPVRKESSGERVPRWQR